MGSWHSMDMSPCLRPARSKLFTILSELARNCEEPDDQWLGEIFADVIVVLIVVLVPAPAPASAPVVVLFLFLVLFLALVLPVWQIIWGT